jgi:hypothetical protein
MTRRIVHVLVAVGLVTIVSASLTAPSSFAAEVRTYADDFSNQSYSASDGSHAWNGPWRETPIDNGSNRGNIAIERSGSDCDGCLTIGEPAAVEDRAISRSADLDGASSARLDISFRTVGDDAETASVRLTVHEGSRSRTLAEFALSHQDAAMQPAAFDITDFAGPDTTIRFSIVGTGETNAELRIAEVTITAGFGEDPSPTSTAATTTTSSTTTTTSSSTTTTSTTSTTTTTAPIGVTTLPTTTTTTIGPATATTTPVVATTIPRTTTTTTTSRAPGETTTSTTTAIVPPTDDPDYATDKVVLVSDNEGAARAVMQPMDEMMHPENQPDAIRTVTFVNAAESVRSTAVYGVGVGLLLAGFLLVGFDDAEPKRRRRRRRD